MPDVIVIGGGPGGSTMGSYLARAGVDVLVIERAIHPRQHVGESMVTASNRVFHELGLFDMLEREGFPRKYGAAWHPTFRDEEVDIAFSEFPQPGVPEGYTFHVDRAKFDALLLKHAEEQGARVLQGVAVKQVLFNEQGAACGVEVDVAGQRLQFDAKVVVDASGRDTMIGRQLRIRNNDPIFDQYAVHAWYENVDRSQIEETKDYIHIYFLPVERGWAWQIPITDKITSVGVVAEKAVFKTAKGNLEGYFDKLVESNAALARAMKPARRVNELKQEGNYSYQMSQFCGDGFVIVGDAARFVDPIFSSGVSVAMHSSKFASEHIIAALEKGDYSQAMFAPYETRLKEGVSVWYEFIRLYYKLLPLFTRYIQSEYRHQILQLLQGDVYDRSNVPVLDAMREAIRKVEETDGHLLKSALSDIPIEAL